MEDLNKAKADSLKLRKKLIQAANGVEVFDKNKQPIALVTNVDKAYDANAVRLSGAPRTGHVTITLGTSTNATATNVPTPTPTALAQSNGKFYPAKTDVPASVLGQKLSFMFIPSADQVTLCDSNSFVAENVLDKQAYLAPTCVQAKSYPRREKSNCHAFRETKFREAQRA